MYWILSNKGIVHYIGHKKSLAEAGVFGFAILALVGLSFPSFKLLYTYRSQVNPQLIVKIVGSQWYWNFEIRDLMEDEVCIYIISPDDLDVGDNRFLEVDNRLILPTGVHIQFNVTSRDVIHCFALPTLGVKVDATAGLLIVAPLYTKKIGVHYGQCSEICGINHAYMPFCLEVTTIPAFFYWVLLEEFDR